MPNEAIKSRFEELLMATPDDRDATHAARSDHVEAEFNRKYAPDAYGEEAADNARVWRVYHDEVVGNDKSLVGGWNKTLDILLIFAGLFSAVATAFIVESYKLLQADYTQYTARLLFATLTSRNGSGVLSDSALSYIASPDTFHASTNSRWINGLWFLSLSISLAVSLLCIMAKQWLEDYSARVSAPAPSFKQWARRHEFLFQGMQRWHVPTLIATLPALLHAALFLFFAGLVIFLSLLDKAIALLMLCFTATLVLFYTLTLLLPLYTAACPTRTSFTNHLHHTLQVLRHLVLHAVDKPFNAAARVSDVIHGSRVRRPASSGRIYARASRRDINSTSRDLQHISVRADYLDAAILKWLFTTSPVSHISDVAIQAVGALHPWSPTLTDHLVTDAKFRMLRHIGSVINAPSFDRYSTGAASIEYARHLRAWLNLGSAYSAVALRRKFTWTLSRNLPFDLQLLEFVSCWMTRGMRWEFDVRSAQATCLQSLRSWNYEHARTNADAYYPVGVYVRLATDVDVDTGGHPATALCVSLHLFHACRMSALPEHHLALVARHLISILAKLGVTCSSDFDNSLIACIEIWSCILNASGTLLLDTCDVAVVARDLGMFATRIAPGRAPGSVQQLPHFVTFLSSSRFSHTRWSLHTLNRVLRLWDPTSHTHGLFLDAAYIWANSHMLHDTTFGGARVGRIFANLAHGLLRAEDRTLSTVTVTRVEAAKRLAHVLRMSIATIDSFPLLRGHPATPPLVQDACESLLCFLHRHEEQEGSAWRAFCTMLRDDESTYTLLLVADALSSHLFHMRGDGADLGELVDEFFAVDWISECVRYYVNSEVLDGVYERLAQHCSELSSHWTVACDIITHDLEQPVRIRERVGKLRDILQWRGPCKHYGGLDEPTQAVS